MRWILSAAICLSFAFAALAVGPDDQFVDVYNEIMQAQSMETAGQSSAAAERYSDALVNLRQLQADHPSWNPEVVKYRIQFLQERLTALGKPLPPLRSATPAAPAATAPAAQAPAAATDPLAPYRAQIAALSSANTQLEQKLKEALSVQPASVSPEELARAQQKIDALSRENDLLKVTLQQAKSGPPSTNASAPSEVAKLADELTAARERVADLTAQVAAGQKKLAGAESQINTSTTAAPAPAPNSSVEELSRERDRLKAELEQRTRDLADAQAHGAQLQQQSTQNQAASGAVADSDRLGEQVKNMRAQLETYEAKAVPYSPEELAVLHGASAAPPTANVPPAAANAPAPAGNATAAAAPASAVKHAAHSAKDLPPGAGALMAEARLAAQERDFKQAEAKYNEILNQDPENVYVLAHLASAEFEAGDLAQCEKTVEHAVALDPDDPASLYLLGILRYRQEKLDEALAALSRSAQLNPTNAGTQNYLGCVLADKGQRPAAETAFRKALQVDPEYPDAHYNLAFVYATEKPPSLELARWHYKRAVDLGHQKSEQLEKILASK